MRHKTLSICESPFFWSFPSSKESLSQTIKRQDLWLQRLKSGGNCLKGFHCDDDLSKISSIYSVKGETFANIINIPQVKQMILFKPKAGQNCTKSWQIFCIDKWLCNSENWEMYEQSMFIYTVTSWSI